VLFFHYADIFTIQRFIEGGEPEQARPRSLRLQALVTWAESEVCRRAQILTHFGETPGAERCGNCDNCTTPLPERAPVDLTVHAQKFLSCVLRTHEGFGVNHIIGILRGSQAQNVLRYRHNHLSTYGIGADLPTATWRHLAHQFLAQGLARQDVERGFLTVTERGRTVLKGAAVRGTLVQRSAWSSPAPVGVSSGYPLEEDLLRELRRLRREIADATGVPAYVIFHDRTLLDLATYLPQSLATLAEVHGMGRRKVDHYGDQLLEMVGAYCAERGLAERPRPRQVAASAIAQADSALNGRARQVVETFLEFKDVAETAAAHNIMRATVLKHLTTAVMAGERLPVEPLYACVSVSPDQQAEVMAAFHELGDLRLTPVYDRFEGAIPYEQLHWLRLIFRVGQTSPTP
jgi:ATP-dependent DNA helicase RecQ